jgi:hypothetical protein
VRTLGLGHRRRETNDEPRPRRDGVDDVRECGRLELLADVRRAEDLPSTFERAMPERVDAMDGSSSMPAGS